VRNDSRADALRRFPKFRDGSRRQAKGRRRRAGRYAMERRRHKAELSTDCAVSEPSSCFASRASMSLAASCRSFGMTWLYVLSVSPSGRPRGFEVRLRAMLRASSAMSSLLRAHGYDVFIPTLTGLCGRGDRARRGCALARQPVRERPSILAAPCTGRPIVRELRTSVLRCGLHCRQAVAAGRRAGGFRERFNVDVHTEPTRRG